MENTTNILDRTQATITELQEAIKNRQPIKGIEAVITHPGAHIDEIFGMFLLTETPEGKNLFPGLAAVAFNTQKELAQLKGSEGFYSALSNGYFLLGTGEGPFDEHGDRNSKISCAQLVANYLGLDKTKMARIIYGPFLQYVNYEDRNGNGLRQNCKNPDYARTIQPALLADNIKKGWELVNAGEKEASTHIAEVFGILRNEIGSQKLFYSACEELKTGNKKIYDLPLPANGKNPAMFVINSDNPKIVSAAKHVFSTDQRNQIKFLLKINSKGQFYLCPMNGVAIENTVKEIRDSLVRKRKLKVSKEDLTLDGAVAGIPELYYHADGKSLMNGSLTQPDIPGLVGSDFTQDELIELILKSLK